MHACSAQIGSISVMYTTAACAAIEAAEPLPTSPKPATIATLPARRAPLESERETTVHLDRLSRDVGSARGQQESHGLGDVLALAEAMKGNRAPDALDLLAAQTDLRRRIAHNEQVLQALRWEIDTLSNDDRLRRWMETRDLSLVPLDLDVTASGYAARRPDAVALGQRRSPSEDPGG